MSEHIHIFGIRHHGPGSARSLRLALERLQPDVLLVEGPPDAEGVLHLLAHEEMQPPVALLIYAPEKPRQAVYYPFATFSPEWQAIRYGLTANIPVRFMDLPIAHQFAEEAKSEAEEIVRTPLSPLDQSDSAQSDLPEAPIPIAHDPLGWLARAAGYSDGERWWEHMVEQRRDSADLFAAILEAMTALRSELPRQYAHPAEEQREARREAWMRQCMRAALAEGFTRIAVVCGAWHAPALAELPPPKEDAALLKGMAKTKVAATWVPWTYDRLAFTSGYGAGVESPGWYDHLWHISDREAVVPRWMTRVARLLREQDLDASSANVIEAVRLAEALAALRDRPLPGLPELNEATEALFCFGDNLPLKLIQRKLIVGERLGAVPEETPMVPLQQDLLREQKRLKLPAEAVWRDLDLDLRKPTDLGRSHLLHRLGLLEVPWGNLMRSGGGKSTFHELWRLEWQPESAVALIEAGLWGNTVADAASARARDIAHKAGTLPALTKLVDSVLLADLPEAVSYVMARLQAEAAVASDVAHLMDALPPLANVQRYGNVRQTDTTMIGHVVAGLVARIAIGLVGACASLNDDAAAAMFERIVKVDSAIGLLQNEEYLRTWRSVLGKLADSQNMHGLVAGRCCRLLLDGGVLPADEVARRMSLALSAANEPAQAAAWVEGLVKGSGLLLLHDETLWAVLDGWVTTLPAEVFPVVLPLLRRTFSTFAAPERRQMGERVKSGRSQPSITSLQQTGDMFDQQRADAVLPLIGQLLGLQIVAE